MGDKAPTVATASGSYLRRKKFQLLRRAVVVGLVPWFTMIHQLSPWPLQILQAFDGQREPIHAIDRTLKHQGLVGAVSTMGHAEMLQK